MGNGENNGKVFDPSIGKDTQFTSEAQPSPEAKKKGHQERKERLELVKAMDKCMGVTRREYLDMLDDMENHPENYTNREVMIAKEYFEKGYMRHFIELNIPKPQEIDMTSKGEKINLVEVKFVGGLEDEQTGESPANSGDSDSQEDTPEGEGRV